MKKYLIRTALVLAAITACNKEIDNQTSLAVDPVEETPAGKVTLTFKANVGEDTRTVYVNDKTGTWTDDDEITVCVTDGESFEIVDFTTEDGETFSAEVPTGYTTIVSGVYPANDEYAVFPGDYFDIQGDGEVIGLYLTNILEMGAGVDQGTLVPMVGSFDAGTQTMSFHHVCGALKVTLSNIPTDASYFTFHANNQQLVFDFPLTSDGRIELGTPVEGNDDMDLTFHFTAGSETTRSFYIPIPDGELASGAYVTLENEDGDLLYKKVLSTAQTFDKNVIKRLPAAECWTRNEEWNAYYYGTYKANNGNLYKGFSTTGVSSAYHYVLLKDNIFNNTYNGSAAEYLSSNTFASTLNSVTTSYTGNPIFGFSNTLQPGTYHFIIYGLDEDLHFTGEYNHVEVVYPEFHTPEGWSISVVDDYRITYTVPSGKKWTYISVSEATFGNTYNNDLEYLIYKLTRDHKSSYDGGSSTWAPITAQTKTYTVTYNGNYILLCVGIDDDYRPTGEYCRLDYSFPIPTEAYNAWIGKWSLSNGDTWTVSRKQANHTYNVKGLCATSSFTVEAELTADGNLLFKTQQNIAKTTYNGFDVTVNLYKRKTLTAGFSSTIGDLMQATMDGDGQSATLAPTNTTYPVYSMVGSYKNANNETKYVGYGSNRSAADVTMTRVTE